MKSVILAEDDPAIRDSAKIILERAGYLVTVLPNADSLLEDGYVLPDLYILDKQLSGVDGLEVCKYLKKQQATGHIPIIMLSANPNITLLAKAACADDALEKPFKMQDLRDMVAKHLNSI